MKTNQVVDATGAGPTLMTPAFVEERVAVRPPVSLPRVIELPAVVHQPVVGVPPRPQVRRDPASERLAALAWPAGLAAGAFAGFLWGLLPAGDVSVIGRVLLASLLGIVVARLAVARVSTLKPLSAYRISLRTVERIRARRESLLPVRPARAA